MKRETILARMNEAVVRLSPRGYKMGDLFKINVTIDGEMLTVKHDTREYYQGRGSKYNNSIRHGYVEENFSLREFNKFYNEKIKSDVLFIKNRKREEKAHNRICNTAKFITENVKKAVVIISDVPCNNDDPRYYINGYFGCGVYRLAIKDGKIVATIYGGYHNSKPYNTDKSKWVSAIDSYLKDRLGSNYQLVKADGSGCQFFLRNENDGIETINYFVPNANGGIHENIQVAY